LFFGIRFPRAFAREIGVIFKPTCLSNFTYQILLIKGYLARVAYLNNSYQGMCHSNLFFNPLKLMKFTKIILFFKPIYPE